MSYEHIKMHLMVRLQFWGVWSIPSLQFIPGPLWPGVVEPVMGSIYGSNKTVWSFTKDYYYYYYYYIIFSFIFIFLQSFTEFSSTLWLREGCDYMYSMYVFYCFFWVIFLITLIVLSYRDEQFCKLFFLSQRDCPVCFRSSGSGKQSALLRSLCVSLSRTDVGCVTTCGWVLNWYVKIRIYEIHSNIYIYIYIKILKIRVFFVQGLYWPKKLVDRS